MLTTRKLLVLLLIIVAQSLYADNSHRHKLSPWLRQHTTEKVTRAADHTVSCMMVLVESADGETSIRRAGGVPLGYADPAWIVLVPANRLDDLSREPAISRIEANPMPQALLDESLQRINVTNVWAGQKEGFANLPQAFTGKGVVAALIDNGTLFQHPMFRDSEGNSRITWFWDISQASADGDHLGVIYDSAEKVSATTPKPIAVPHGSHVAVSWRAHHSAAVRALPTRPTSWEPNYPTRCTAERNTRYRNG